MFIFLLFLAALSIAGSAAYFSVYGLANTFHGTFWSVVIMGGSLEVGKLIAASYLYRYWNQTQIMLRMYLTFGIIALMLLTSTGIFGYLSTGYQTDALPLKQLTQHIQMLEDEKIRSIERKKQIDNQIANLPSDYSKSRIKLMNSFKAEQEQVTTRINDLDKETLDLKTKSIQTEAHIGPITYIAKAFNMDTDDATKYLIYLIIFVFDPMAVALTLAVNIALRVRKKEREEINDTLVDLEPIEIDDYNLPEPEPEEPPPKKESFKFDTGITPNKVTLTEYVPPTIPEKVKPIPEPLYVTPPRHRVRPYAGIDTHASLEDLLQQFQYFKTREDQGDVLTADEQWAFQAIKNALQQQGYNIYV